MKICNNCEYFVPNFTIDEAGVHYPILTEGCGTCAITRYFRNATHECDVPIQEVSKYQEVESNK